MKKSRATPPDFATRPDESVGHWLALAVGSLVVSGVLALALVIGRLPPLAPWLPEPAFFRRCLVVHVDLSLVVWLLAFSTALTFLLPRDGAGSEPRTRGAWWSRGAVFVALGGVLVMLLSAGVTRGQAVLANYVPAIDHGLFRAGLCTFGLGVVLALLDRRLLPERGTDAGVALGPAIPGLRATAIAIWLMALTFAASWLAVPRGLEAQTLYELTGWGAGHVLQLAASAAMVSVWLMLLTGLLGAPPLGRRAASLTFAILLAPWLSAPLLALAGVDRAGPREGFTTLMRFGVAPAVLFALVAALRKVIQAWRAGRFERGGWLDPRLLGFLASAVLTVQGYVLGALIRGSTTTVPAHYHAAIGGVTVSFMAMTYPLLARLGVEPAPSARRRRLAALQPALFGLGQAVFALGFALAGAHGTGRKLYGAEQAASSFGARVGLLVMGLGGLCAVCGGLLYLGLVVSAWSRQSRGRVRYPALAPVALEERHG